MARAVGRVSGGRNSEAGTSRKGREWHPEHRAGVFTLNGGKHFPLQKEERRGIAGAGNCMYLLDWELKFSDCSSSHCE